MCSAHVPLYSGLVPPKFRGVVSNIIASDVINSYYIQSLLMSLCCHDHGHSMINTTFVTRNKRKLELQS